MGLEPRPPQWGVIWTCSPARAPATLSRLPYRHLAVPRTLHCCHMPSRGLPSRGCEFSWPAQPLLPTREPLRWRPLLGTVPPVP